MLGKSALETILLWPLTLYTHCNKICSYCSSWCKIGDEVCSIGLTIESLLM